MKRHCSHAGSWYSDSPAKLRQELRGYLSAAQQPVDPSIRAVIVPHAGFRYSGPTAAYSYSRIDPKQIKKVFILGPSHHVYLKGCALSNCQTYDTPLGNLTIDPSVNEKLFKTGLFSKMDLKTDENEHSIEMQLPFLAEIFQHSDYTIIPILVGSLSHQQLEEYGRIFSAYLNDPQCLLVISSDFCHWGSRFQYTYLPTRHDPIYKGIERMDLEATSILQQVDVNGFSDYLSKTQNTICGKFPIFILLKALSMTQHQWKPQLLHYQQSSQVRDMNDSSVSYVSMAFQ